MGYVKRLTTTLVVMFIVSCSASEPPPPPAKTVFDPLTRELDKAREVQTTVDENAATTRKAIDTPARGDTP